MHLFIDIMHLVDYFKVLYNLIFMYILHDSEIQGDYESFNGEVILLNFYSTLVALSKDNIIK